jgi:hypothetical protein
MVEILYYFILWHFWLSITVDFGTPVSCKIWPKPQASHWPTKLTCSIGVNSWQSVMGGHWSIEHIELFTLSDSSVGRRHWTRYCEYSTKSSACSTSSLYWERPLANVTLAKSDLVKRGQNARRRLLLEPTLRSDVRKPTIIYTASLAALSSFYPSITWAYQINRRQPPLYNSN